MVALLFPGQGSQSIGMGKALYDTYDVSKRTFEEADDALGFKISDLCFAGDEDALKRTENTQPAILTTSIAAYRAFRSLMPDIKASFALGHSLGEWSALTAVGALEFADAVKLVHQRGRFMQQAVAEGEGAMSAIIGIDKAPIVETCVSVSERGDGIVTAANFNGPAQTVISGSAAAVEVAEKILSETHGAKVTRLAVSAPFHCPLMEPAAKGMNELLADVQVGEMEVPVISNVEATANQDSGRVTDLLVKQITGTVQWVASIQHLVESGETVGIELGCGRVLAGLNRRIDRSLKMHKAEDPTSLEKAVAALGA